MEKRIAIYEFDSTLSQNEIVKRLLDFSFTKESVSGFTLSKSELQGIRFRHIRKVINTDTIITPFGEELENTTIDYAINDVKIYENMLFIFNPSRSLTPFRNEFLKALGFQCTISIKSIDLKTVLHLLESNPEYINVTNIELFSHDFLNESRIKMVIESNKELIQRSKEVLLKIKPNITKIGFEMKANSNAYFVEVNSKGIIKIKGGLIEKSIEDQVFDIILHR